MASFSNNVKRLAKAINRSASRNDNGYTEERIKYLLNEVSELRQQVRMLLGESQWYCDWMSQTRNSFDAQWDLLPEGAHLASDSNFLKNATLLVEEYTGFPAFWFSGKKILDAGCGNGRWSYVLSSLGAEVTAVDQSAHGLENARRINNNPSLRTVQVNLLEPLPLIENFDMVWSFGVLHHTGNTYRAFQNVQQAVKPGGFLFMMIYGEPTRPGEFQEINTYVEHRRAAAGMSFPEKIKYLEGIYPSDLVHGYFDAISPAVNDLHRFDELKQWLVDAGFDGIRRTHDNRNVFVIAQRRT